MKGGCENTEQLVVDNRKAVVLKLEECTRRYHLL